MNDLVKKLFWAIADAEKTYCELADIFGEDHMIVNDKIKEINGMKKAFSVIAGFDYCDLLITTDPMVRKELFA